MDENYFLANSAHPGSTGQSTMIRELTSLSEAKPSDDLFTIPPITNWFPEQGFSPGSIARHDAVDDGCLLPAATEPQGDSGGQQATGSNNGNANGDKSALTLNPNRSRGPRFFRNSSCLSKSVGRWGISAGSSRFHDNGSFFGLFDRHNGVVGATLVAGDRFGHGLGSTAWQRRWPARPVCCCNRQN